MRSNLHGHTDAFLLLVSHGCPGCKNRPRVPRRGAWWARERYRKPPNTPQRQPCCVATVLIVVLLAGICHRIIQFMIRSSKNWRAVGFVRTAPHESRSLPARLPARQERGSTQASTTPAWPCLGVQRQEGRRPCAGPARFAQAKRRRTNQPSRRRCRGCAAGRGETVAASRLPWTRNQRERIARVFKVGVCDGPPRPVGRRAWELTCTWCGTAVVVRVRPRIPEDLRSAKKYRIEYKDCVSITNNEEVAISKCVAGCAGQVMRTGSHTALCARADPFTSHAPFSSMQCCHPTQHSKKRTLQPRERS